MLTLSAYAKVNLTLEVLGRRDDGYHEIATVLQTIGLADTISLEPDSNIRFICDDPNIERLESPEELLMKTVRALQQESGCQKGVSIRLTPSIPKYSGLGGGSSDAAAILCGLNKLWDLNLPRQRLVDLAARLGSDMAFFLYGSTALARGRGEKVTPLRPLPKTWLVLLRPPIAPIPGKTGKLYARLNASHFSSGQFSQRLVERLDHDGSLDPSLLFNVFEAVAFDFFPELAQYRSRFLTAGAARVNLSGAGPCLFTLVPDRASGEALLGRLRKEGLDAYLVATTEPAGLVVPRQAE